MSAHPRGLAETERAFSIVDRAMRRWEAARGAAMTSGADWRAGDTGLLVRALRDEIASDPVIAAAPEMVALLRDFVDMVTKPVSRGYLDVAVDRARTLLLKIDEGPNSERSEG